MISFPWDLELLSLCYTMRLYKDSLETDVTALGARNFVNPKALDDLR